MTVGREWRVTVERVWSVNVGISKECDSRESIEYYCWENMVCDC